MATRAFVVGAQPEMVPSSLANMKRAAALTDPFVTTNLVPPLETMPVGAAGPAAPGTLTTRAKMVP